MIARRGLVRVELDTQTVDRLPWGVHLVLISVLKVRTPAYFVGEMNSTDENDVSSKEVKWQMSSCAFEAADAQAAEIGSSRCLSIVDTTGVDAFVISSRKRGTV